MQRIRETVALCLTVEPPRPTISSPAFARAGAQQLEFPA